MDINQEVGLPACCCVLSTVKLNLLGCMCEVVEIDNQYIDIFVCIYIYIFLLSMGNLIQELTTAVLTHISYNIHLNFRT